AEDGDARKVELGQFLREPCRFLGRAMIGEVSGEEQALRLAIDPVEGRGHGGSRIGSTMQIADGCDLHAPPCFSGLRGLTGQRVSPCQSFTSSSRASR